MHPGLFQTHDESKKKHMALHFPFRQTVSNMLNVKLPFYYRTRRYRVFFLPERFSFIMAKRLMFSIKFLYGRRQLRSRGGLPNNTPMVIFRKHLIHWDHLDILISEKLSIPVNAFIYLCYLSHNGYHKVSKPSFCESNPSIKRDDNVTK